MLICGFGHCSTSASTPPVAGRSQGPFVADAKAFTRRASFSLLFNVSTSFCLFFFFNSSSGSCYLIPFYNISLKLPDAFLKQGRKGIQNHCERCSLGLFLSLLRWVPQGPQPSSISISAPPTARPPLDPEVWLWSRAVHPLFREMWTPNTLCSQQTWEMQRVCQHRQNAQGPQSLLSRLHVCLKWVPSSLRYGVGIVSARRSSVQFPLSLGISSLLRIASPPPSPRSSGICHLGRLPPICLLFGGGSGREGTGICHMPTKHYTEIGALHVFKDFSL